MDKPGYGDAPIEQDHVVKMNALARVIDGVLNEQAKGPDRPFGFILLVFPYGEQAGRCNYISNGADRKDVAKLLREQASRFDKGGE